MFDGLTAEGRIPAQIKKAGKNLAAGYKVTIFSGQEYSIITPSDIFDSFPFVMQLLIISSSCQYIYYKF